MNALEKAELGIDGPRIGRDELNLTEFPFALLATRASKKMPTTLEFRDGEKEWVVSGDPRYGLPTAGDVEVYIVLMELTREQGFPLMVQFSRHNVIRRLGWDPGGQSYDRLLLSLDRLVGVTIRTQNAFWDAKQRSWVRRHAFHLLEAYEITDSRQARPDEPSLFPSWVRWSPELYQNIHAGYIKTLDVDLFLSLGSSISQALYRYLDAKRYDGKPFYRIGLKKLAFEHLGLSRNYFPSDIKRKLKTAHDELIENGFLSGVEYALMKNGEDMVVYRFGAKGKGQRAESKAEGAEGPAGPVEAKGQEPGARGAEGQAEEAKSQAEGAKGQPEPVSDLAQQLIRNGVSRATAIELAAALPADCEAQLGYLPYRDARDPGAVLVKSIREGWSAPQSWMQAQERQAKAAKTEQLRQAKAVKECQEQAAEAAFDTWWAGLPAERRDAVTAEAWTKLRRENRMMAEFAQKHPDSPILKGVLRPLLKALSGWTN